MSSTPYQDEEYAYTTAAINNIFVMAGCPNKFRQYIDCLIGLADKAIKFEASDKQVSTFARGRAAGGTIHAEKGWAKEKRTDLMKWQDEGNLEIVKVEVQPYDSTLRMRPPTKYTLNILEYAEQVVGKAKNTSEWGNSPLRAIYYAAEELVRDLTGRPVNTPKEQYIDPPSEVKISLRTARTNLKKAAEMLKKYDFQLMREDEKLVEEVEKYIKRIRDRGFVDDMWEAKVFFGIKKPKP